MIHSLSLPGRTLPSIMSRGAISSRFEQVYIPLTLHYGDEEQKRKISTAENCFKE